MNVFIISHSYKLSIAPDSGYSIDVESGSAIPLDPEVEMPRTSIVVFRSGQRGLALITREGEGSLTVNGQNVSGVCSINSNALIRAHLGNRIRSFAALFDDSVVDIPVGSVCDICGQVLREIGKGHCKRKLCSACIETFAAKCPDCGKQLLEADGASDSESMMREFLLEGQ